MFMLLTALSKAAVDALIQGATAAIIIYSGRSQVSKGRRRRR